MKLSVLFSIIFVVILIPSKNVYAQLNPDLEGISVEPRKGKILILQNDSIPLSYAYLAYKYEHSNNPTLVSLSKKYKRKNTWGDVLGGIGLGVVSIWMINEAANTEFHNTDSASNIWRRSVIGASFSFCIPALLFKKSAKKQVILGLEELN